MRACDGIIVISGLALGQVPQDVFSLCLVVPCRVVHHRRQNFGLMPCARCEGSGCQGHVNFGREAYVDRPTLSVDLQSSHEDTASAPCTHGREVQSVCSGACCCFEKEDAARPCASREGACVPLPAGDDKLQDPSRSAPDEDPRQCDVELAAGGKEVRDVPDPSVR